MPTCSLCSHPANSWDRPPMPSQHHEPNSIDHTALELPSANCGTRLQAASTFWKGPKRNPCPSRPGHCRCGRSPCSRRPRGGWRRRTRTRWRSSPLPNSPWICRRSAGSPMLADSSGILLLAHCSRPTGPRQVTCRWRQRPTALLSERLSFSEKGDLSARPAWVCHRLCLPLTETSAEKSNEHQ